MKLFILSIHKVDKLSSHVLLVMTVDAKKVNLNRYSSKE